ncbi:MAG: endo-beta-N-acetylglucosaminidase, partial [Oscillospiraceae bacterium]
MSSKIKIFMKVLSLVIASLTIVACTVQSPTPDTSSNNSNTSNATVNYDLDEQKAQINSANAPISSYWFPEELLVWNASEDKDLEFNKSKIPLAKRVDKEKQYPVNETQNKDTKVVAISIMNASTSGNLSQGTNQFASNTFSYWQYIDKLVYWGGSSGEGLIIPPSPEVTDAAHKNGVSTLGTIFFPMLEHGGKMEWLDQFLQKDADGNFPMVDKLIEVATTYGFDGWFINQETQGEEQTPLTANHAANMQELIKEFKEKAGDTLEIMWYDSMTKDGEMDWQNAVTDKNEMFLIDADKKPVSDSMFLNFWWTNKSLAEQELLKASQLKSESIGFDSKEVYAGIDLQEKGTLTPIRWDLLEKQVNDTFTSIGLYCPSWTFFSSNGNIDEFEEKESGLWVNEFKNPAQPTVVKDTQWKGISTYAIEKSVVTSVPFETNFNMGNGYNFFINGEKISSIDWSNRSLADVMPTYRWIMEHEGNNKLTANIDYAQAYYGGNSIKFRGNIEAEKSSIIKLFSADLTLEKGNVLRTVAKSDQPITLDLLLEFHDGEKEQIKGDKILDSDWTTVDYPIETVIGKPIKTIGFVL